LQSPLPQSTKPAEPADTSGHLPSLWEIANVFGVISMTSFGGGQKAQIRRKVVSENQWCTDAGFLEALTFCELLPGPNVLNLAIFISQRVRGIPGALVAFCSVSIPPFIIIVIVGWFYFQHYNVPFVHSALMGAAAAAVGLTLANAVELTVESASVPMNLIVLILTTLSVSYFGIHLLPTLVILGTLSGLGHHFFPEKPKATA
jgi:chromate transporter